MSEMLVKLVCSSMAVLIVGIAIDCENVIDRTLTAEVIVPEDVTLAR
jgi:hypothetical protein